MRSNIYLSLFLLDVCLTDDNCNAVEFCDHSTAPFTCAYENWFLGTVIGVGIFVVLVTGACVFKCLCK